MQAMSFSAWNGLGLALVIPCVQSLIADVYSASARGRAFGLLFLTSSLSEKPTHPALTSA
jgi:MFS family permease